jgi:hypothetical protein
MISKTLVQEGTVVKCIVNDEINLTRNQLYICSMTMGNKWICVKNDIGRDIAYPAATFIILVAP